MSRLTEKGFIRGTYEQYVEELENRTRELYGSDVDLSESSPHGQMVRMLAYEKVERDDLAEAVYNANSVDTAEGVALDNLVKMKGIVRNDAIATTGIVLLHVNPGTVVSAGAMVGIPNTDIHYYIMETVSDIDGNGFITAMVEAVEPGAAGNAAANTISEIITPIAGLNGVSNSLPFDSGADRETDAELRNRFYSTTGSGASVEGLRSLIMNDVPGVRSAIVIENVTNVTDVDGRPPNSFETIVLGGEREDIAKIILANKPGGIRSYGEESVIVTDTSGIDRLIEFSYAEPVKIYAQIEVKTNPSFPIDGQNVIKLETVKYIGGVYNHNTFAGLGMGRNVIHGRIASKVFSLTGVDDVTVRLSTDGVNYLSENILINFDSVAEISEERVVVNIV